MEKHCQRSNQKSFQIFKILSVALLVVWPFCVSGTMTFTPTLIQTERQSFGYEPTTTDNGINLNCSFETAGPIYICRLNKLNLTKDTEVTSVSGTHLAGKTNADVRGIHFKSGTMYYLPMGIEKFFSNLNSLVAGESYDTPISFRYIKRTSLSNLKKLTLLSIFSDVITEVDDDAFWDLNLLQDFLLSGNGSITLNENTFQENIHLKEVVFLSTLLKDGIPAKFFRNNRYLNAVYFQDCSLKLIEESLFHENFNLSLVSFISNKLEHLPKNLFQQNGLLEVIDFSDNLLKTIDVDFTKFLYIDTIDLEDNACIDAYYEADAHRYDNAFTNLTELQSVITSNCSTHFRSYSITLR